MHMAGLLRHISVHSESEEQWAVNLQNNVFDWPEEDSYSGSGN